MTEQERVRANLPPEALDDTEDEVEETLANFKLHEWPQQEYGAEKQ
jgi:hypothetical protein